jgi:hypothetical protein
MVMREGGKEGVMYRTGDQKVRIRRVLPLRSKRRRKNRLVSLAVADMEENPT